MRDIHLMIDELAAWDDFAAQRTGPSPAATLDAETRRQLSIMRNELTHVSVMTAAAASIINRIVEHASAGDLISELAIFKPAHSRAFLRGLDGLADGPIDLETCANFQEYHARLALAHALTEHVVPLLRPCIGDATADWHRSAANTADAWQRACAAAVRLHERLTDILPAERGDTIAKTQVWVLEALKAAAAGDTPCIDHTGGICLPGWIERRRDPRIAIECAAILIGQGRERDVVIVDVSMRGLGLVGEAIAGQPAGITLAGGRALKGRVEWAIRGRFGMALDQPLLPGDSLLNGKM